MVPRGASETGDALRQRYNGMVNIPLAEDTLGLRVVGFYRDEEGWVEGAGDLVENKGVGDGDGCFRGLQGGVEVGAGSARTLVK